MAEELPQPILHRCSHRPSGTETLKGRKEPHGGGTQSTWGRPERERRSKKRSPSSGSQRDLLVVCVGGWGGWPHAFQRDREPRAEWKHADGGFYIYIQYTLVEREGERDAMLSHDLLFSSTLTWLPGKPVERRRRMGRHSTNS